MAKLREGFWQDTALRDMSKAEWEALCDGCGRCCLVRLEDEDSGEIYETNVACRLFDAQTCRCMDYARRHVRVPECARLTADNVEQFAWLPETCAYRRLAEGRGLPEWHPLVSGDPHGARRAGVSVFGTTVREQDVDQEDLEDHIIR